MWLIALLLAAAFAQALCTVAVSVTPAEIRVAQGQEFTASVYVEPQNCGVSGGEVLIRFSPHLAAVEVKPGDLLGRDPLVGKAEVDNGRGYIWYALARVGATEPPTPPGVFIAIRFKAVAPGETEIKVEKAGFADDKFSDAAVTAKNAKVVVTAQATTPASPTPSTPTPIPTTPSTPPQETATTTAHYQIPLEAVVLVAIAAVGAAVLVLMARRKT